jgi:hypothetical protein
MSCQSKPQFLARAILAGLITGVEGVAATLSLNF